jgi:Ca2+-transporting ATPase
LTKLPLLLHDVVTSAILAIIVIVVAVPEGLPMMIAIVLSLNMRRLLKVFLLLINPQTVANPS